MKDYVYFKLNSLLNYFQQADTIGMCVLGRFLTDDFISFPSSFIDWMNDDEAKVAEGNATYLYKEDGFIVLSYIYSEEEVPTEIKVPADQFLNILLEWKEKLREEKPKGIILRQENGKFLFETKNCTSIVLNKKSCVEQEMKDYVYFTSDPLIGYIPKADTIGMYILGCFLASDCGLSSSNSFIDWVNDDECNRIEANITILKKENGFIVLSDLYSDEEVPTEIKIPVAQFLNILLEWRDKVCKEWPKSVVLRQENGKYIFEIKNLTFVDPCAD